MMTLIIFIKYYRCRCFCNNYLNCVCVCVFWMNDGDDDRIDLHVRAGLGIES